MSDVIVVTNVYNEQGRITPPFDNIERQTKPPVLWIWINDGSYDMTAEEIEYNAMSSNVRVVCFNLPPKPKGNKFTIGRAWNQILPLLKSIEADYLTMIDVDTQFPPDYLEKMCHYMDIHPDVGCAAGVIRGEIRREPQGGGKFVRMDIIRSLDKIWDLAPDYLFNIKAEKMGYRLSIVRDLIIDAEPSTVFTSHGKHFLGKVARYVAKNPILVLIKALEYAILKRDISGAIKYVKGYIEGCANSSWQTDDVDVRRRYSLRRYISKVRFRRTKSRIRRLLRFTR